MKNLQARILKIVVPFFLLFPLFPSLAKSPDAALADSLFRAKHFTESMEHYQKILNEKNYSPAMLLKMAYIQEGLGKIGPTLYYLKLYSLATNDEQVIHKMEELAAKYKVNGYETNDADRLHRWFKKNLTVAQVTLVGLLVMALSFLIRQRRRTQKAWSILLFIILLASGIFYINNYYSNVEVIVNEAHTYLMNGPSAGASVSGIVDAGNQLTLLGHDDVWLKVKWQDKIVYVKRASVLTPAL